MPADCRQGKGGWSGNFIRMHGIRKEAVKVLSRMPSAVDAGPYDLRTYLISIFLIWVHFCHVSSGGRVEAKKGTAFRGFGYHVSPSRRALTLIGGVKALKVGLSWRAPDNTQPLTSTLTHPSHSFSSHHASAHRRGTAQPTRHMTNHQPRAADDVAGMPRERRRSPGARHKQHAPTAPRRAIRPLLLLVALVNLAWSLYQLPVSRVLESRLCREHYAAHDPSALRPDGSVPEELCKVDEVQQRLGRIQGTVEALWVAGGRSLVGNFGCSRLVVGYC